LGAARKIIKQPYAELPSCKVQVGYFSVTMAVENASPPFVGAQSTGEQPPSLKKGAIQFGPDARAGKRHALVLQPERTAMTRFATLTIARLSAESRMRAS